MSIKAKILPNYTYQDYCRWEGRWEIIEGIPYAMSPMPSPRHQRISSKLSVALEEALNDSNSCACDVYQPIDVKITDNTVVNPDVLIVCKPIEKQYLDFPPVLVVEILSPSTHLKDRHTKYDLYQNFGIKYYLIVDPEKETVEIYQLDENDKYALVDSSVALQIDDNCSITPDLKTIW